MTLLEQLSQLTTLDAAKNIPNTPQENPLSGVLQKLKSLCTFRGNIGDIITDVDGNTTVTYSLFIGSDLLPVILQTAKNKLTVVIDDRSKTFLLTNSQLPERVCEFINSYIKATLIDHDIKRTLYYIASQINPGKYAPYLVVNTGFGGSSFTLLSDRLGRLKVVVNLTCPPAIEIIAKKPEYIEFFTDLLGSEFKTEVFGDTISVAACDPETKLLDPAKLQLFVSKLRGRLEELAGLVKQVDNSYSYGKV